MNSLKAGLVVFGLVIGTAVMAQEKTGKTPQERAQFKTDWMAKELSLTAEQKTQVAGLNMEAVEKNQGIRNNASLTAEQKKAAWQESRKAQKEKLKTILTAEQLAVLKAKKEEMHAKHKEGMQKHAAKTPQERAQFRTDWMAKELSLTAEQKAKVTELNLVAVEKNDAIRKDASLTETQKKEAFKAAHLEQKTRLQETLTAEQLATLKAKKQGFHGKHKEHKEKK